MTNFILNSIFVLIMALCGYVAIRIFSDGRKRAARLNIAASADSDFPKIDAQLAQQIVDAISKMKVERGDALGEEILKAISEEMLAADVRESQHSGIKKRAFVGRDADVGGPASYGESNAYADVKSNLQRPKLSLVGSK